ncbi:MAG: 2-C-methyl-D-erythritol 4-phosphate cytidylyltransferase [Bacteroidaceae bacterium]|nr:2-C-methyl-D-erythritol 4-phosphate cytidylyltransferase [Bacteroidaceae bacterium]
MEYYAILVAGGKGVRMGGDIPKQFLPIGGRPVLMRTIDSFVEAFEEIRIILVLPESQQEYWHRLCEEYDFRTPVEITSGGETRYHSVKNGLSRILEGAEGIVGVHDGVRPFASAETIRRCYHAAEKHGAVVPVIPVVETIRQLLPNGDSQTVSRDAYRLVQTPQTFRISLLKQAYRQTYQPFFTDDASVVEAMGHPISLVEGNRENIKITTPTDLKFAEMLTSE